MIRIQQNYMLSSCGSIIKKLNFKACPVRNYNFNGLCWYNTCPPRRLEEDKSAFEESGSGLPNRATNVSKP
jgi:hypothetical protein